jgi:hypothetical protein
MEYRVGSLVAPGARRPLCVPAMQTQDAPRSCARSILRRSGPAFGRLFRPDPVFGREVHAFSSEQGGVLVRCFVLIAVDDSGMFAFSPIIQSSQYRRSIVCGGVVVATADSGLAADPTADSYFATGGRVLVAGANPGVRATCRVLDAGCESGRTRCVARNKAMLSTRRDPQAVFWPPSPLGANRQSSPAR